MTTISLRTFGYKMANKQSERWAALDSAVMSHGHNDVIERLKFINGRNPSNIIMEDIEYMEHTLIKRLDEALASEDEDFPRELGEEMPIDQVIDHNEVAYEEENEYAANIGELTDIILSKLSASVKNRNKQLSKMLMKCVETLVEHA